MIPQASPPGWRARLLGPRLGLPLMALGLAALLPGRLAGVAGLLPAWPAATAVPAARPLPSQPVALREGVIAVPHV